MTDMLEALDRKRGKGPQIVRVERHGLAFRPLGQRGEFRSSKRAAGIF